MQETPGEHIPEIPEHGRSTGAAADLEVHANEDDEDDSDLEFAKKVEEGLRAYIETGLCRRQVADQYFNNPKRDHGELCGVLTETCSYSVLTNRTTKLTPPAATTVSCKEYPPQAFPIQGRTHSAACVHRVPIPIAWTKVLTLTQTRQQER